MNLYVQVAEELREVDVIVAGVVEAGPNNFEDPSIIYPAFYLQHLLPQSKTTKFYHGKKASQLAEQEPVVATGCILGGGSSITAAMYARGQRGDYDAWNTEGWSTDELLPYLKSLETYHGRGVPGSHGYAGEVHVSDGGYRGLTSENDFIAAMQQLGYPETVDLQSLDANNGVERSNRYVSLEGRRQDTAHVYLHPKLRDGKHPNLHVLVGAEVRRVLLNGDKRAVGIEYKPRSGAEMRTVKAKKLVVVSGGACGTPLVLERSGVGKPDILERAGVPVLANVPGVGRNFQDHQMTFYPLILDSLLGDPTVAPSGQYVSVVNYNAYPYSRGHIHITGPDLEDAVDFEVGFFGDAHDIDLKKQLWAYKKQREIMRRTQLYRGEVASAHPRFPPGSAAACVSVDAPLRDVRNFVYSAEGDAAIEQWLRERVGTLWHSLGTRKMAPRSELGVVDPDLSVYGVQGLKVADLSIPPLQVGANTNNTAMVIGEKAADIIIREMGLGRR
ncbi:hypothetical protein DL764_008930 [Monosporascus ibericus]|uniref:Glucose-methanol-choline oxidoreductase N-terminal domain-containing protein n=1 Tax=Monosporascus ibericus TaxID=155417 RepID=A0A4Q4SW81_9PEZI|nr:hypothetical protein DL764_008930 [Monosporascus ibericus]